MNAVLTKVKMFQASDYSSIVAQPEVQRYLNSVRYIEELQKFLEDDHFKYVVFTFNNNIKIQVKIKKQIFLFH